MKEKILKLRAEGRTYKEIQNELKCSKGLISYYCGKDQKEKTLIRQRKHRSTIKGITTNKINFFRNKIREFKLNDKRNKSYNNDTYEDFYLKIINNPKCYLTGRDINLNESKSYNLDHIIPLSKGGNSNINNMGLACRDANMSKFDMTIDEYLSLCKEVLENFGYEVLNKNT